jgi:hypothetical protein
MTWKKPPQFVPFIGDGRLRAKPSQRTIDNLPHKVLARPTNAATNRLIETFRHTGVYGSWTGGQFWIIVEYCLADGVPFRLYQSNEFRQSWLVQADSAKARFDNPEDWKEFTWN